MIEIKFRAWFEVHKRMVYNLGFNENSFKNFDDTADLTCVWDKDLTDEDGRYEATFNFKIMQYTGLHDKNNKEIYEGDIYIFSYEDFDGKNKKIKYQVIFRTDKGCFAGEEITHLTLEDGTKLYNIIPPAHGIEVIGNIYENQELLNV